MRFVVDAVDDDGNDVVAVFGNTTDNGEDVVVVDDDVGNICVSVLCVFFVGDGDDADDDASSDDTLDPDPFLGIGFSKGFTNSC